MSLIRGVYLEYKGFGFEPIKKEVDANSFTELLTEDTKILKDIWRVYGKYDADYLEVLTHSEQPWLDARAGMEPDEGSNNVIDLEQMKAFYQKKLKTAETK